MWATRYEMNRMQTQAMTNGKVQYPRTVTPWKKELRARVGCWSANSWQECHKGFPSQETYSDPPKSWLLKVMMQEPALKEDV